MPIDLDMDVLRTLLAAQQLGALNRAAEKIGRSQSAVTQQIRKLEDRIVQPLFRKQGRGLILTEAGEIILAYAMRREVAVLPFEIQQRPFCPVFLQA